MTTNPPTTKRYNAPALAKGLDILELLAAHSEPLSQKAIAGALHRSINEVFRMLITLSDRGYISRANKGDGYVLTMRLHNLAQNWPPSKHLLDAALPEMRRLAVEIGQSCHLSVYSAGQLYVIANEDSPLPVGVTVRVGSGFRLADTASGRVLLAFQDDIVAEKWKNIAKVSATGSEADALNKRIANIRKNGLEKAESNLIRGLTDISCPVMDQTNSSCAALTVPVLSALNSTLSLEDIAVRTTRAAQSVSERLGYQDKI
jgi:DNA-binding IclR family transcriptional regulator